MPYCAHVPPIPALLVALTATLAFSGADNPANGHADDDGPPLRLAVAGLVHGHVGGLLANLSRLPHVELVGIAEADTALARIMADRYNIDRSLFYDDLSGMLDAVRPEAVAAFGTTHNHLAVVEASAPLGIHVMVEKPLAVSMEHARRMSDLTIEHGIHLLVNYETTWYPSVWHTGKLVMDELALGTVRKIVIHDGHPGPREIGVGSEFLQWLVDPDLNGAGALYDFGCYGANLATWLLRNARPLSVTAVTQQLKTDPVYAAVDDEATVVLTYPETQVIIQASWNWPFNRKDMVVYGEKGLVYQIDSSRLHVRMERNEEAIQADESLLPFADAFQMLRAVSRGISPPDPLSSLENNLLVTEILEAARFSAGSSRAVFLQ